MVERQLSHLSDDGKAHMVDISSKNPTERIAIAGGEIHLNKEAFQILKDGQLKKGDALAVAQIAGIMAAKKTAELIPLCHPIQINQITVDLQLDEDLPGVQVRSQIKTFDRTGAEMEALSAVSVACLTVYDMIKAVQKDARIHNIRLIEKHGGKSGDIVNG
jgi:cyclic pyranopterin monophosphate synthase